MSGLLLKEMDITSFRSISGHVYVPLDAKVVLIHGDNGAGKTSLLSAIELGLTGSVQSMSRADPDYARHLLHRSAKHGTVSVKILGPDGEQRYVTHMDETGPNSVTALEHRFAAFFGERTYLPQSLLGQLLGIYQESDSGADSPLARFVSDLLGLDRLDALEAGLKPFTDVRNVRKVVEGWSQAETAKDRCNKLLDDQRKAHAEVVTDIGGLIEELSGVCKTLGVPVGGDEETLESLSVELSRKEDEERFDRLMDQQRQMASIRRELTSFDTVAAIRDSNSLSTVAAEASSAYASWDGAYGSRIATLRSRIENLLAPTSLPSDYSAFGDAARTLVRSERRRIADQAERARTDIERLTNARDELEVSRRQSTVIDEEISRIPETAGGLGTVLSELGAFIDGDVCPVCDQNFVELDSGGLARHVQDKVVRLSASAERLIALGRSRSQQQLTAERLESEIETLEARVTDAKNLADLDRHAANLSQIEMELDGLTATLAEGTRLRAKDIEARRAVSEAHSRNIALAAARESLNELMLTLGASEIAEEETLEAAASRLQSLLSNETSRLQERLTLRRKGIEFIATINRNLNRRKQIESVIANHEESRRLVDDALQRGQALRKNGNSIRKTVEEVRSSIIRREFNDRLNRVWRDLFVRLAPSEPFVPAFRIPQSSTRRLQPKLITEYRDGGEPGGTPGVMLSTGNLNTAALTLFIALHLSAPKTLPWLIFDDPVQSMDDMHITHFASLLRTLSKEHGRQVVISVHDRQLFEYLRLELSPAYVDDSLLTLELTRRERQDTLCVSERLGFKEETALRMAA